MRTDKENDVQKRHLCRSYGVGMLIFSLILFWLGPMITLAPPSFHAPWNLPYHSLFHHHRQMVFTYQDTENNDQSFLLKLSDEWLFSDILHESSQWRSVATDWSYTFRLKHISGNDLNMELVFRRLVNNDCFVFFRFVNPASEIRNIQYSIAWTRESLPQWSQWQSFGFDYDEDFTHSQPDLIQIHASNETVWKGEMRYFKTLEHEKTVQTWLKGRIFNYRNLEPGLIERQDMPNLVWLEDTDSIPWTTTRSWISPQSVCEDWYLYSNKALLNINSARTKKVMETTDFSLIKRFGQQGFFYQTQSTGYLNENRQSYYWDYSMYSARSILEYYYNPDERFFFDFASHCFLVLASNLNEKGYWQSGALSIWLNNLYGLGTSYFDTRFSVDAGLFLLFYHERFHSKEALDMAARIGDLLLDYMRKGLGFKTPNDGMMIQDYICETDPSLLTHASLNHLINEANFLLKLYEKTTIIYYRNAAIRIIKGITATEELWKNQKSNDFYYALFPDGSYQGKDYLTLTYHDILRYHQYAEKYLKERTPALLRLGQFKEDFLFEKQAIDRRRLQENKTHVYHHWEKSS